MSIFAPNLLAGKTAFITGGGSGINLAIAELFAQHGAKVALVGRTLEKTEGAAAAINAAGGTALGLSADVRDYAALNTAIEAAVAAHGPLDIVICGAAGNFPAPADKMSANAFKSVVDIDLLGTFNTCRAAFAHLRQPGACVVAISAMQSLQPMSWQAHVCAAKAGVDMLIKSLSLEWGPLGIRLNSIAPGPVADTEGMKRLSNNDDKFAQALPLKRYAEKSEIADLALFLCSHAARNITGAVIPTDGGFSVAGEGRSIEKAAQAAMIERATSA